MAAARKGKKATSKPQHPLKRRLIGGALATLVIIFILMIGWMAAEANWVRYIRVEIPLKDLPKAFDGVTVMFVTDLHIDDFNTPERTLRLMDQLSAVKPDILCLGGDYVSRDQESLAERIPLLSSQSQTVNTELKQQWRERFFQGISGFPAEMLRVGVPGDHDLALPGLRECMERNRFMPLINGIVRLTRGDQSIVVAGLDDWKDGERNIAAVAGEVTPGDCVILISHNPDALPMAVNTPSRGGAGWVDLFLSGHTHGGQITLFGKRSIMPSSVYGDRYLTGFHYYENGGIALVSNGVGTTGAPLRFFAPPQVHLLTLRRAPGQ